MTHLFEMVTVLLGLVMVGTGCVCLFRIGGVDECPPEWERRSMTLVIAGTAAVVAAMVMFAVAG